MATKENKKSVILAAIGTTMIILALVMIWVEYPKKDTNNVVQNESQQSESEEVRVIVAESLTLEAGSEYPKIVDFLDKEYSSMSYKVPLESYIDMNLPGEYEITLLVEDKEYTSVLCVEDTTAPEIVTKSLAIQAWETEKVTLDKLVESVMDLSETTLALGELPDLTLVGNYEIPVVASDAYGNTITELAIVEVLPDTEAPVIEGVKDISGTAGGSFSYKKDITVTDNSGEEIALKIDKSKVDTQTPGTYKVYYTATDSSGNVAKAEAKVTVKEKVLPTEESLTPYLDKIIANVTNSSMSKYDKAYALWNWCRKNISYSHSSGDRSSIWAGVYEGVYKGLGDCYAFYATYSALLTRCDIENMCVARINGETNHWWNLVNVGDGWYHCDSSPRSSGDPYLCFMQTDAQVEEYTANHTKKPNYYTFDKSLYPERATTIIFGE